MPILIIQTLQEADLMASRPKVGDVYREYVERCFKSGAMDFDDLLLRTNELLARFPESLANTKTGLDTLW